MANQLCFQCFKIKGDYEVCPHCGYSEKTKAKQVYQLAPGTVLHNRYIIGTSIGFGGFGITYKAFDTVLSVVVAIKEFYPAGLVNRADGEIKVGIFSGEKEEEFKRQLERFLEEARNMALFSKEKDIVSVIDFFEENNTAYIIMEYVEAPLLKTRLKEKGKFESDEAVKYILAILDALSKVHYHGIIHKDMSPDNIFITGEDSIKLFDFGAAKLQGTKSERTEAAVVKAGYTPPEQYRSKNDQGPFMDIYAVGAIFYEMLTGEKPMEAPDRSVCDELKKPSEYGIEIDDRLERVILKALALQPELRFQTAEQFKNAIVSQKKVELPEEELKRRKLRKRLAVAALSSVIAIVGVVLILSQTVFSGRGKIDVARIEEDSIEVWLWAEDEESGENLSDMLQKSVEKECPQLDITLKVFKKKEYTEKLKEAIDKKDMPDVFCTDALEGSSEYCGDLSKLLKTLNLSSYLYLDDLEKEEVYDIPTAAQVAVAYLNEEKLKDLPDSMEFEDLDRLEEKGEGDVFGYGPEKGIFDEYQNPDSPLYLIAANLSYMDKVKAVTIDKMPPTDFKVVPLLQDGKLVIDRIYRYGVSKDATDNQQEAGMVIISLLLGEGMQSAAYMDNDDGIPLNRSVLENYRETKMTTYLSFLKEYDFEDVTFLDKEENAE